jgi:hypothetical protein
VNDRDWLGELCQTLQAKFVLLCEKHGQPVSQLRISPAFTAGEARHFLIGLENDLFDMDDDGWARSVALGTNAQDLEPHSCPIFASGTPAPRMVRENISRLAIASMIVFERGWLPAQVRLDSEKTASSDIDGIIESAEGKMLTAIEIKRSAFELQKFVSDFGRCCRRGEHAKSDCAFQQNHGVFEFCARNRPPYLWIVAPEADVCFKLTYANAAIELEELPTLPPRSHIEFGLKQSGS